MSMRRNPALIASLRAKGQNVLADQLELEMPDDGDNPDTIVARGRDGGLVEISLVDEIAERVANMTPARQRELLEQLKS